MNPQETYASCLAANVRNDKPNNVQGIKSLESDPPRRREPTIMSGKAKAGKDDTDEMLCADVDLVVVGVSKNATKEQLKNFIMNKGICVLDIEKLYIHFAA